MAAGSPVAGVTYVLQDGYWTAPGRTSLDSTDPGFQSGWGVPVWRDEFDYRDNTGQPTIDPAKWNIRDRSTFGLLFDASVIEDTQISVDQSGICHIKAEWLDTPTYGGDNPSLPRWHKTGYMEHRNPDSSHTIFAQPYGRWEIKAKVPTAQGDTFGALPAFWLRNTRTGEIDIMESWGSGPTPYPQQKVGTSTTTVHTQTSGAGNIKKAVTIEPALGIQTSTANAFHTWALEFTPNHFRGYYDGQKYCDWTPADTPQLWNPSYFSSPVVDTNDPEYSPAPLHVRVNLHVGPSADYWGYPDNNHREWTVDPLDYQIEYVRIWKYEE